MRLSTLWGREPALILGALEALIALALAFGLDLDAGQVGAIMAAAAAVIALITRQVVTPPDGVEAVAKASASRGQPVTDPVSAREFLAALDNRLGPSNQ